MRSKNLLRSELLTKLQEKDSKLDEQLLSQALQYAAAKGDVRCIGRRHWHLV